MKNLKKLSRENLKSLNGGGIGTCGAYFPTEPPLPGEPFDCGCSNLYWCEKEVHVFTRICIQQKSAMMAFNDE
uniref:Bacteriocin n=1 Tax=Chryseobacterium endophyticum TaxID=1854762 RepID=A0AAU6WRT4_9FLAO